MQFKHPEILYFLFLLIIPILVHLFQLRKFKKEYFTNVKLLKEISIQTRKSSSIKKWLLLFTRLLLLSAIVFAFAQPYLEAPDTEGKQNELVILLDNSFSMQAKGNRGELLKRAVQDILENTPELKTFSLLTSSDAFWDTDIKSVQKNLQQITYNSTAFRPDALYKKIKAKKPGRGLDIVIISDGLGIAASELEEIKTLDSKYLIPTKAENNTNAYIENVTLLEQLDNFYKIKVSIKTNTTKELNLPVAVYNQDNLVAKALFTSSKNKNEIVFTLPKKEFHGYVSIQDNSLLFDNTYFFSIAKPQKTKVTLVGEPEKNNFLTRIFTNDEFEVQNVNIQNLDFNTISQQHVVVLNEIPNITPSMGQTLKDFYSKGGVVVFIPNFESEIANQNQFLKLFGNQSFTSKNNLEKQITAIQFAHPLYQSVFEKKVTNFQYPKTNQNFTVAGKYNWLLRYADQSAFLTASTNSLGGFYVFSSPLNLKSCNFINSPLVVPTFYNMAILHTQLGTLAYTIGHNNALILDEILNKDHVVTVANNAHSFIPMQHILNTKLKLTFGDYPTVSGNYYVQKNKQNIGNISFNYPRNESQLDLANEEIFDNFTRVTSVTEIYNDLLTNRTASAFWKYFVIAALLFLLLETLIQKFVK